MVLYICFSPPFAKGGQEGFVPDSLLPGGRDGACPELGEG